MKRSFTSPLGIDHKRTIWLEPGRDPDQACRSFDAAIVANGGLDLAILGLGPNGHLGFNEPPSPPDAPTRLVDLAPESLASNAKYWGGIDAVPRRAVTAGLATILAAREVLVLVSGAQKRAILNQVLDVEPNEWVPASLLRLRTNVTILCDESEHPLQ